VTISFIVPLYNGLDFTRAMMASLRATVPAGLRHEIILVDNGSTDGTRAWLARLGEPGARAVLLERNLGYAAGNNRGAEAARGDMLLLLNNDLVLLPGWLEPMLKAVRGGAHGVVGNVQISVRTRRIDHAGIFFDRDGTPYHFRPAFAFGAGSPILEAPAATGACLAIRRSLFGELHGFDEGYTSGYEDIDLCLRAREMGLKTGVCLDSHCIHYIGASEGRHDNDRGNSERFMARWAATTTRLATILPPKNCNKAETELPSELRGYATLQVFQPDAGGYSEQNSTVHLYRTGRWARVTVPLERGLVRGGVAPRLDPCDGPAIVRVAALRLTERGQAAPLWTVKGRALWTVLSVEGTAHRIEDGAGDASLPVANPRAEPGSGRWLTVASTGNDPRLVLRAETLLEKIRQGRDLALDIWMRTDFMP
jgi:GT2 family glycosyltransferase